MENALKVAHLSLSNARECLEGANYGRAFAHFLLFLKLEPSRSEEVYLEFSLAAKEWSEELEHSDRMEDLFKCYDQACEMYPNHDTVLNNIGAQLFRLGYVEEAAAYIRRSLLVNPNYLAARDNLENICSHLVERWHFSMLNDKRRNIAYKLAIEKAVKSGYDTVLDIGTGTGILSLMSESAGARTISACDCSRAMVEVARDVLAANGVSDRVALIHKGSTELAIPQDLPRRVKLVVTEIFDAGLFGEHAVSTLIDAWKNLISTSPMGTIIPCGATMYVCGIECESIRQQNRLLYPVLQYLDLSQVDLLSSTGHVAEEPYTTENLAKVRGGYKIITNISELLRVNFCNLFELESLNKGKNWTCDLYVKQRGQVDALAVWFDLQLDDSVTIATGADDKSCWEQAIFPVTHMINKQVGGSENCMARKKETLRTTFHFEQDILRLEQCEILEETKPSDSSKVSISEKCDCQSNMKATQNATSELTLPFRKRKVEPNLLYNTNPSPLKSNSQDYAKHNTHTLCHSTDSSAPFSGTDRGKLLDNASICNSLQSVAIDGSKPKMQSALNTEECSSCVGLREAKAFSDSIVMKESANVHLVSTLSDTSGSEVLCNKMVSDGTEETCNKMDSESTEEMCNSKDTFRDEHVGTEEVRSGKQSVKDYSSLMKDDQKIVCLAEQAEIEYINDIDLNKQYVESLERYCRQHSSRKLTLLYLTQRLSFVGIQACKMGFDMVVMVTPEEHHQTITQVAELNGCTCASLILVDTESISSVQIGADVLLCDIVDPYGALGQHALENITFQRMTSLNADGLVLPQEVKIYGMYIESDELESINHVTDDDRTLDFAVAEHINVFQMQSHMNIDLSMLSYTKLSEVFELMSLDLNDTGHDSCNNLLDKRVERCVPVVANGKISAAVYWFELKLAEDLMVHTVDARCHWKQAAVMMKEDIHVAIGQNLVTMVTLQNSCLSIKPMLPHAVVNGGSRLGHHRH